MPASSYPADDNSKLAIQIAGNLKLLGWEKSEIQSNLSREESLKISEEDDRILIQSPSNVILQVPAGAGVQLETVQGNASISGLTRAVEVSMVRGNLKLNQINGAVIEKVYGNARVKVSTADVALGSVYGNLKISDVQGAVSAKDKVKGNVVLTAIQGADIKALGNATLSIIASEGEIYNLEASGNIHCYLDAASSASIIANSGAGSIRLDLPEHSDHLRETTHKLQLGDGSARVTLRARGYVHIANREPVMETNADVDEIEELEEMSKEINFMIDRQMEALEREINEKLSHIEADDTADLSTDIDEIVDQARKISTLAAFEAQAQAEKAAQKAQSKLAAKLEKAKRRSARFEGRKRRWTGSGSAVGQAPPSDVSEEERLMVLKMVEENKITLEEADQLLAAMEGKDQ